MKVDYSHITTDGGRFVCEKCNAVYTLPKDCNIDTFYKKIKAFKTLHKDCK